MKMKKALYALILSASIISLTPRKSGERYLGKNWQDPKVSMLDIKEALSKENIGFQISKIPAMDKYFTVRSIEKIVKKESNFDPFAVNQKTEAKGLMQIRKKAWQEVNPDVPYETNWYKPKANIETGIRYLGWLTKVISHHNPHWRELNKKERTDQIIAGFNWGYGNLEDADWKISRAPPETKNYIAFMNKRMGNEIFTYDHNQKSL